MKVDQVYLPLIIKKWNRYLAKSEVCDSSANCDAIAEFVSKLHQLLLLGVQERKQRSPYANACAHSLGFL